MDGKALARRLRAYPELDSTALASLSSQSLPQEAAVSRLAGCLRHLVKPLEPGAIAEVIADARLLRPRN